MRILHLVHRYYPARGGAESHMGAISAYLAAAGHEVTVATTDAQDFELFWQPGARRLAAATATHEGVRIRRFPVRHLPLAPLTFPGLRRLLWLLGRLPVVPTPLLMRLAMLTPRLPDLRQWLAQTDEPFDVVAGMTITLESLLITGRSFARRRRIPFVCYPLTHLGAGAQPGRDDLSRFYTMRHQLDLVTHSDAVVAQTETEKQFYVDHGLPPERALVGGPGVHPARISGGDAARFRQRQGCPGPIVLAIGAMAPDKGTPQLVQAAARLWANGADFDLVLIGAVTPPFRRFLANLPDTQRPRLHLLADADEATKRDALAACTLLALPSRTDSFGMVYLEAWLYGKPVIGAQTWGVMDLISDEQNGLLVPFGDVPALAGAIERLLTQPAFAHALGERGRQTAQQHTWAAKLPAIADLYARLTAAAPM